jgi:hypothetical protein
LVSFLGILESVAQISEKIKETEQTADELRARLRQIHPRSETVHLAVNKELRAAVEAEREWKAFYEDLQRNVPHKLMEMQRNVQKMIADEIEHTIEKSDSESTRIRNENVNLAEIVDRAFAFGFALDDKQDMSLFDQLINAKRLYQQTMFAMRVEMEQSEQDLLHNRSNERNRVLAPQPLAPTEGALIFHNQLNALPGLDNQLSNTSQDSNLGSNSPATGLSPQEIKLTLNCSAALEHLFEAEVVLLRKVLMNQRLREAVEQAKEETVMFS